MKSINRISINHVKGIEHLDIDCDFLPNKPNFLVAPNGTGKSSLATAFLSLNTKRLRLEQPNWFNGEDWDDSSVSIGFRNGVILRADANSNEITKVMDVQVIKSGLYANMSNRNTGSRILSQTKISIQQCVLCENVPNKINLNYLITDQKKEFPKPIAYLLHNFKAEFDDPSFLEKILNCDLAFNSTHGNRYCAAIDNYFKNLINLTRSDGIRANGKCDSSMLFKIKPIIGIKPILEDMFPAESEAFYWVNAIQLNRFISNRKPEIKKQFEYLRYREAIKDVNDLLMSVNRTRLEIKAHIQKGKAVIDFPDWDKASNGEIDVLQLCASLAKARLRLGSKDMSLLIIDEVFDYLDDANLIVSQYCLLKMMNYFKVKGKSLFVIILTHLDPSLFKSYRFKKIRTSYIQSKSEIKDNGCLAKLLRDRRRCKENQPCLYDTVSTHYLHYSNSNNVSSDVIDYIISKDIDKAISTPFAFREEMQHKLTCYLEETPFSVSEVCCGLRITIEQRCYERLNNENEKQEYLKINTGTEDRLDYAEAHGCEIPDAFHLLGGIYNSCMHLSGKTGEEELVRRQLENNIIRHMIKESLDRF